MALWRADGKVPKTPVAGRPICEVKPFRRALRWAGATDADPFADVRPARDPTAPWEKRSPYQHADVEKLLAVAGPQDQVLILLCAHAGLQVSEAIALRWDDIDPAAQLLTVQQGRILAYSDVPSPGTAAEGV